MKRQAYQLHSKMSSLKIIVVVFLMVIFVSAQNSATTTSGSYFTVDPNAEPTSTKNWWGDNVDNGIELTTTPISSSITSPNDGQATTNANVQGAGVVPIESATISGAPNSSTRINATDNKNSTSSTAKCVLESSAFILMAYAVFN